MASRLMSVFGKKTTSSLAGRMKTAKLRRQSLLVVAMMLTLLGSGVYWSGQSKPTQAAGGTTFELFATHPYASQSGYNETSTNYYTGGKFCPAPEGETRFCPAGQRLTDMEITDDGQLFAGYGDWTTNSDSFGVPEGRVGMVPLNIATKQWDPLLTPAAKH